MWDAWNDLSISGPRDHALGDAVGRFWLPASQDARNATRSYARYGYYDPIRTRTNYHLLIRHKVEKIELSLENEVEGVIIHDRNNPTHKLTVKAKTETVIAMGGIHTPQILQLSGIGSKPVLEAAGIEQKVDLPGVGENFQDHPQVYFRCNFTNDLWPNPGTLQTNVTFRTEALAEYNQNKTGPLTLALSSSVVFLPLKTTHSAPERFLAELEAQAPAAYLPVGVSPTIVAGFVAQKKVLGKLYASDKAAPFEGPFGGSCGLTTILQKPLSRGNIHINPADPRGPPVIDFRVFSNPLDVDFAVESLKFSRKYIDAPTLAPLKPVELAPGENITDARTLENYVHATGFPTSFHVSGTAAMMPRELGGVVGSDLKVYGVKGLSIVDASIFPLIPSAHLSASVYAVAEKAADIIKARK